jgi:HlyD family secretion protein
MRRFLIGVLVLVLLVGGSYFGYRRYQRYLAAQKPAYQTVLIQKGVLTTIIGGTGTARSNQTAEVAWQTSGDVEKINVILGDRVTAGQALATLKDTSLPQTLIMARSDLIAAQKNLDTLKTSMVDRAKAEQTLAQAQKALDDALHTRELKKQQHGSPANTTAAEAQYYLAESQLKSAENVYGLVAALPAMDPGRAQALSLLASAQIRRDTALANWNYMKSHPDAQEITEADDQVVVAQANLKAAQDEWNRLKNGPDPRDVTSAELKIQALQISLQAAVLKAPIDGNVTVIDAETGDNVLPGTVSFRIDDLSHLYVDVPIAEIDINRVAVGQSVRMVLDANPNKEYHGTVSSVSRVGTTNAQGAVDFNVTIEVTDADEGIKPGMTVAANIVAKEIQDVLLVPNRAVRLEGGKHNLYILKGNRVVREEVQVGDSSDTESSIAAGNIKVNDAVILNPPVTK